MVLTSVLQCGPLGEDLKEVTSELVPRGGVSQGAVLEEGRRSKPEAGRGLGAWAKLGG